MQCPAVANAATESHQLDYPESAMEQEAKPHAQEIREQSDTKIAASGRDAKLFHGVESRATVPPALDQPPSVPAGNAKPETTPPLNKWQSFWRGVLHVDTAKMQPWIALRNSVGVSVPLAVGIAMGMPLGGLAVPSGALNVAYSDGHDPYGQRAKRMLASSALCAIAVMAGGLAGHHSVAAVALAMVWAFGSGMAIALGTNAEGLGVISLVVLIVYSAQALTPERALQASGLAFVGGLIQTFLSLALWPVRAYEPERRALANLYIALGKAASSPA